MENILTYLGIALGVGGLVASYYFYKNSLRIKEPVYSIRSNNVISGSKTKYENLKVLYYKKAVENFTVSKILFFNRGNETIIRSDIETSSPLRITAKDCEILDLSVIQVNKTSNKFALLFDESGVVHIDFDYLDKNQGGVIQVAHTGLSNNNLLIEGDIMGVQKITKASIEMYPQNRNRYLQYMLTLSILMGLGMFGLEFSSSNLLEGISEALLFIPMLVLVPTVFLYTKLEIEKGITEKVPEGLEKFLE